MWELANAPEIAGALDGGYLAAALERAGRSSTAVDELRLAPLTGGRTGARVTAVRNGAGAAFVVKAVPRNRGFTEGLGNSGEGMFWLAGLTRALPRLLSNPTFDVAHHVDRDEWWLLMDDVSAGIPSRREWTEDHSRRLFEAIAGFHARHWGLGPDAPAGTLTGTTGVFVETALHAATDTASAAWVARAADEFPVPGMLLPAFLEALDVEDADFYIALCRRWRDLVAALERFQPTLLHGDLRRANIALTDDRIVLFDWEFLARGPAAVDLAWHWFLHYWAYPPDDGKPADARLWLRDAYLNCLEARFGERVDRDAFRVAWELGWLRVFCQLGFVLADPLTEENLPRTAADRVRARCKEAVARARRLVDAHVQ